MKKEKIHIEYIFDKAGKLSIWNHISTPAGLAEWFADEVMIDSNDKIYTFVWGKHPMEAELIGINPNHSIRFRWLEDESTDYYFELSLHKMELTGAIMLEITDFAEKGEEEDITNLWDSQIKILKRNLGL